MVEKGGTVSDALQGFRKVLHDNDMLAYIAMMAPRLVELRRVLKPTGSIYLHCDPTASHYLKMLMDAVFRPENFSGEIIWRRTAAHVTSRRWPRLHDTLLHYAKDLSQVYFVPPKAEADEGWIEREYRFEDKRGRYMVDNLTGAGTTQGPSGQPWRGIDPKKIGAGRHWRYSPETLDRLDSEGRIYWPKKGKYPKLKQYLDESGGKAVGDIWTDISLIGRTATERLGYPTQKPTALLDRIIGASSKPGNLVMDPFCGCGTAIESAEKLERRWIGIDITHLAIALIKHRLKTAFGGKVEYEVIGEPVSLPDAQALAQENRFQFQCWALGLVGARPTDPKRGADRGIDGRLLFHDDKPGMTKQIVISVKSGTIPANHIRELRGVVDREKAAIGLLITLEKPTKPMRREAASAGFYRSPFGNTSHPRVQILTVEELFQGRSIDCPRTDANVTFKKSRRIRPIPPRPGQLPFDERADA
jgi:DNA modification methylase